MAGDKKISELDAIPAIADGDLLAVVDLTDTTTKRATAAQFKEHVKTVGKLDEYVATPGQTAFTLSEIPSGGDSFALYLNGKKQLSSKYSFTGTALTWGNSPVLIAGDTIVAWYDWQAPVFGLFKGTYAGTLPAVGVNLVVTAAQLGLTDARQIVMSQLMGRGTDQNWYFAGNTWGGATHDFNYTIPTLADPNLGNMVIQMAGGATTVAGQPFEFIYLYQATNFLS